MSDPIAFSHTQGLDPQASHTHTPTLRKEGGGMAIMTEHPNDAIPIQGTIIGRQDHNGPNGPGFGNEGDPMYTIDSVSLHGVSHNMVVRRLTPLECERLMGWPDNHTAISVDGPVADTHRYKMCGNGVASPVAEWIGKALLTITKEDADE